MCQLPHLLAFLNKKADSAKLQWDKFYNLFKMNFARLEEKYTDEFASNLISSDILKILRGNSVVDSFSQSQPNRFLLFIIKDLANNKILGRLEESSQLIFTNLEEDLVEKVNPMLDLILAKLEQISACIRAKEATGFTSHDSLRSLGISHKLHVQPLLNYAQMLSLMSHQLVQDLSYFKQNLSNFFVYINSMIIKLIQADPLQD